jgi:hypothetical protein
MRKPRSCDVLRLLCVLGLAALLAACGAEAGGGPRAWIDVPTDGAQLPAGQEVLVQSHAYARAGVAEVMLLVNGTPYRRDPPSEAGASFAGVSQAWVPEGPGEYNLQVVAYDASGAQSEPTSVWVAVREVTPTPVPTETPVPTPTHTQTPEPTATSTPLPPPELTFQADRPSLAQGECTTLRWETRNATNVTLNGEAVELAGSRQVCPSATTDYRMIVSGPSGQVEQTIRITVAPPPDTTAPTISGLNASTTVVKPSPCSPDTVTIRATVSDAGGLGSVMLFYRVTGSTLQGAWRSVTMSASGGSYQATLAWADLQGSLNPVPSTGTLEYYVQARDAAGNTSRSGTYTVEITYCLI